MNKRQIVRTIMRAGMLLAVSGGVLFQTSGCTLDNVLATFGLSTIVNTLVSTGT